jgi:hypothetical protein
MYGPAQTWTGAATVSSRAACVRAMSTASSSARLAWPDPRLESGIGRRAEREKPRPKSEGSTTSQPRPQIILDTVAELFAHPGVMRSPLLVQKFVFSDPRFAGAADAYSKPSASSEVR